MSRGFWILLVMFGLIIMAAFAATNQYNALVPLKESVNEQWGQVENVYQRRADLIPNLVNTVKGYADFEQETLTDIVEARAKVGQLTVSKEVLEDPELMKRFTESQNELSQALSRFLSVTENYPDLKSNQLFSDLMVELGGAENRITNERRKYLEVARTYNTELKKFPTVLFASFMGMQAVPYFEADESAKNAPKVDFN